MTERKRVQVPLAVLCLLVAMVAVGLSLFLSTYRHNAQLMEMTQRHNAQLVEQSARLGLQMQEMTARHNAQMTKPTAEFSKEVARLSGQASGGDTGKTPFTPKP